MKQTKALICCFLIAVIFTGCGKTESAPAAAVDLQAFMEDALERYELGMAEKVGDEMLDAFYPGLRDIDALQCVVYMPMITSVVSEYALLQCADGNNAKQAAEILQKRIDSQAGGGAWYPESMEAWAKAEVIVKGNYVAMIAAGDLTEAVAKDFSALL